MKFRPLQTEDQKQIIGIFNYYIENSFAAYLDSPVPEDFFDIFSGMIKDNPTVVAVNKGEIAGFGFLKDYHTMSAFAKTKEITYFIRQNYTRHGLGSKMLEILVTDAKQRGVENILANISSRNNQSICFHKKMGFEEVGVFKSIGIKNKTSFDVIWMQKSI